MGSSKYYTLPSDSPKGNWNEGFLFAVAYHTQLFDTIEVVQCYKLPSTYVPSSFLFLLV
ncbi:hypothetical protein BDF14DRAFT_1728076 [Spinellus fusiger]|nr:hypothetical protein BDF14DRAFT_1728076 [Spinellus fusiger]